MTGLSPREPVISIDGPAGAGKGTVARNLADRLGYRLLDTGAMYRALALSVTRAGIAATDSARLAQHLDGVDVSIRDGRTYLGSEDVTDQIRTQEIGQLTSALSAVRVVREKLTPLQQRDAARGGVVLEGRDTGTVVCPDADVKFYLTASLDARARRRHAELLGNGVRVSFDAVRAEVAARDAQDMSRSLAPLTKAPDAIEIDTTDLAVHEVVELMVRAVEDRRTRRAAERTGAAS